MIFDTNIFNNREKAIAIWILIFFIWALFQNNILSLIFNLVKFLFTKLLVHIVFMVGYISFLVFLLSRLGFWNISMIPTTLAWFFGTAFVIWFNANEVTKNDKFFRKIALDTIKISFGIGLLGFIVNWYVFNLIIEFFIVPVISFIVIMSIVAATKREHTPVKKLLDFILGIVVIYSVLFALKGLNSDFYNFATIKNLYVFLLPPVLTFAYLPFIYFLALYIGYENLFVRIHINKKLARFVKKEIFKACFLSLKLLNQFTRENAIAIMKLDNKNDIKTLINKFKNNEKNNET